MKEVIFMNRLEKTVSKWNFKKIAIWYLVLAVAVGIICTVTVGYIYRERLMFAWQYSRIEEAKDENVLKSAADKTAASSEDVVDVLILNKSNDVIYSAQNSPFADGKLEFVKVGNENKYLTSPEYPDALFRYVKGEEFMINSIINKDFGEIRKDYDDDSIFDGELSSKTVYMLSRIKIHGSENRVYVITVPTSVPGGMSALKVTAALAMLFFCVYWVLIALWMYKDAAKSKLSPLYWGLIGLLTNIIGLIVYKIYRRGTVSCSSCGAVQSSEHLYCSFCGTKLGVTCENCGYKVGAKDSFCHHCGNKIR